MKINDKKHQTEYQMLNNEKSNNYYTTINFIQFLRSLVHILNLNNQNVAPRLSGFYR